MLRTRTDLFRVALLASIASTACGGKSETTNPNTNSAANSNTPNSNTPSNNTSGSNTNPGSVTGTAGSTGTTPGNNTMPNVGAGGATLIVDGGSGPAEGGASSDLDATTVVVSGCNSAAVILDGEVSTGLAQCDNGVIHRPLAVECPNNIAVRDPIPSCEPGGDVFCPDTTECASDADCTAQPYGRCIIPGQAPAYACAYGCTVDSECGPNQVCLCGADIGTCHDASCSTDGDCSNGMLCAGYFDRFGVGCGEPIQLACQTANDECAIEEDCEPGYACNAATGTRVCTEVPGVACGRPFVVDDVARLAPTIASRDFTTNMIELPLLDRLSQAEREILAEAWTEVARMEHASIAAFARFSLQLLSLGAPCALIEECNRALADETVHAQLAFSLASHYAARPIGPGRLPMDGALEATALRDVLELVVVEGCIGETVAALEAAEALAHCRDEAVEEVLRQVHRDETRHAALAWRFVAWAVEQDASLIDVVTRTLHVAAIQEVAPCASGPDTLRHGVLTTAARSQVRQAALRDVILPCAAQLHLAPTSFAQHAA
jgi:hypothetical protein